jgi:hypothetical protein
MTLFDQVTAWLDHHHVRFTLIGAGALSALGVSDDTLDQELLVTNPRVLNRLFWRGVRASVEVDAPVADDDQLAGRARLTAPGERPVRVVAGRARWLEGVIERSTIVEEPGRDLPAASLADQVLLNLYFREAGNLTAIRSILGFADSSKLRQDVESRLSFLPTECVIAWQQILERSEIDDGPRRLSGGR